MVGLEGVVVVVGGGGGKAEDHGKRHGGVR